MGGVWSSPEVCRNGSSSLIYFVLADLFLILHFTFILLVMLGAVLVLRWRRIAWIHVPCALWGAWIEFRGWISTGLRRSGRRRWHHTAKLGQVLRGDGSRPRQRPEPVYFTVPYRT